MTHTRPRRRGRKVVLGVIALVLAGAIVAVAATLLRAPITGSLGIREVAPNLKWSSGSMSNRVLSTDGELNCSIGVESGALKVTVRDAIKGESCTFQATVEAVGDTNQEWRVQSIDLGENTRETILPRHCGQEVRTNGADAVQFTVTVGDLRPGEYPVSPEAALTVVPADAFDEAKCSEG